MQFKPFILKYAQISLSVALVVLCTTSYATAAVMDLLPPNQWRYVCITSLLINFLLVAYIYSLRSRNTAAQRLITEKTKQLEAANNKLEKSSRTDDLTQLANSRYFDEYLETEWCRARREKRSLSLVLIDVDFFKNYNNHYGHTEGERCLQQVALSLRGSFNRSADVVARYGGEEFAAILPDTELGCDGLVEICREMIMALEIDHVTSQVSNVVTVSIGACTIVPSESLEVADIMKAADKALCRAKQEGRNRSVVFNFLHGKDGHGLMNNG